VKDAADRGVLWVNSAGNEAERHYRGQYVDANGNQYQDFKTNQDTLSFRSDKPVTEITLRWDDWDKVDQDFELNLLDADGNLLASSRESQSGAKGERPVEQIDYAGLTPGDTYYVAIYAARADRAVTFDLYFEGDVLLEFSTSDHSLISPADAREALAIGAVNWSTDRITDYSSRGPTVDGRLKPDLAAPSEIDNVTYGHFGGTSAAAPHVAGAAALVWSAFPNFDRQQVWDYLISNAIDRGPAGADDAYGAGRLQLPATVVSTAPTASTPVAATAGPTSVPPVAPTVSASLSVTPIATSPLTITITPTLTATPVTLPGTAAIPEALVAIGGGLIGLLVIILVIVLLRRGRRPKSQLPQRPAPQMPPSYPATPPPVQPNPQGPAPQGPAPRVPTSPIVGAQPQSPSPVVAPCPHCGKPVRVGAKFCAACGKSIAGQPLAPAQPTSPRPAQPPQLPKGPAPRPPKPSAPPPPQVMVYCKQCGQPLRQGAKFCAKCGTRQ
jgi:hypothetical protein